MFRAVIWHCLFKLRVLPYLAEFLSHHVCGLLFVDKYSKPELYWWCCCWCSC